MQRQTLPPPKSAPRILPYPSVDAVYLILNAETAKMANILKITDVYGDEYFIDCDQLDAGVRKQITLYTKTGEKKCDYHARMNWSKRGLCTTIHRENIASVIYPIQHPQSARK